MKYIDLIIQTLFALALLMIAIVSTVPDKFSLLLALQFCVGVWQVFVSAVSAIRNEDLSPRIAHLKYCAIYFVVFLVCGMLMQWIMQFPSNRITYGKLVGWVAMIYLIGPPWALAIYHYVISWRLVLNRHRKTSNFLPHINF
jgi:hypothetical protein